ncbi:MAG: 6-phosphofructokinase [Pirellulaceae bacterium]
MKRIGILTAGGDTPALNATLLGAASRANELKIELIGLLGGFNVFFDPRTPHVHLNPLFETIPELDATVGGTVLGSSRRYLDATDREAIARAEERVTRLGLDGLICIGGDGTINGMQALCEIVPAVLAPKTIDNDLGLNYLGEADGVGEIGSSGDFDISGMVNYATPGYATAVYVATWGIRRVRTTAESHHRIAIVEVMGRHSGYIALGAAYGQPDIILLPEQPIDMAALVERVCQVYDRQKNVVIVVGEGIVDADGKEMGASRATTDPSGNSILQGAAEALRTRLVDSIGDAFFQQTGRVDTAARAIFTRKVGHTQRGGRPLKFDRYQGAQLGGHALDMIVGGESNSFATLQWNPNDGFTVESADTSVLRGKDGMIHARRVDDSFYDARRLHISDTGIRYLVPIFSDAIGAGDVEQIRHSLFDSGNLRDEYRSISVAMERRTETLD